MREIAPTLQDSSTEALGKAKLRMKTQLRREENHDLHGNNMNHMSVVA